MSFTQTTCYVMLCYNVVCTTHKFVVCTAIKDKSGMEKKRNPEIEICAQPPNSILLQVFFNCPSSQNVWSMSTFSQVVSSAANSDNDVKTDWRAVREAAATTESVLVSVFEMKMEPSS
ncbi:hypothetical protein P8452_74712 [Trifolium repens]|nr:hypothetical protein P8452_74712 [Trifolium repens]